MLSAKTAKWSRRRHLPTLLFILSLLVLFPPSVPAASPSSAQKVLVLTSYKPTSPVAYQWARGLESAFGANPGRSVELIYEHLDLSFISDERYMALLYQLVRHKLAHLKPDLIVAIYNGALKFAATYGQTLFGDVPVVFGGVEEAFANTLVLGPYTTGVLSVNPYRENFDLALNLHPDTKHVAVVAGAGIVGKTWGKAALEAFRPYANHVSLLDFTGLPMETILEKVADLPDHAVLIYITLLKDGAGQSFSAPQSCDQISRAANAPVYSLWNLMIGHGMVGGYLSSAEEKGKQVAQVGLRLLNGDQPADIPFQKERGYAYMFDWRQLQRWSIDEDKLPPGSIVAFREVTTWDKHRGKIIAAFLLIGIQALIITYLIYHRRKRNQAETRLAEAERKYRTVSDYTYDWEYWENFDGSLNYISPSCERITGHGPQEFLDNPALLQEIVSPEDKQLWDDHILDTRDGLKPCEIQFRIRTRDGQIRWIEHVCQPIGGRPGKEPSFRASNRDITIRKKHEAKIAAGMAFEQFVSELSSEFINLAAEKIDGKIVEALSRIGSLMNVDRTYLFCFNLERTEFKISHLWEAEGIDRDNVVRGALVPRQFPWLAENLLAGRAIVIDRTEKLPPAACLETEYCKRIGIQSFAILPVQVVNAPLLAIGLDSIHSQKSWPEDLRSRLAILGEILANSIARQQAELKLIGSYDEIRELKDRLLAESTYLQEEIKLEQNFENIIGQSQALKYVLYRTEQVAETNSPVLIQGETGTGKELIARAIHTLSARDSRAMVKVNCAALPGELIENELFGHERGAFTGADRRQIGRFELARGSSIFLDEIGELPLALQAKLLQVLECGEFERLGSSETLRTDARIIASTNRELEKEIKSGRFREDLWYRLNVFPITMPPLRQRIDDIPLLAQWFSRHFARKTGKPEATIRKSSMKILQAYSWPGNVRELKNVVQSAMITSRGSALQFDLPKTAADAVVEKETFMPLDDMERDYIVQVLNAHNWKIAGKDSASEVLKLNPSTLRSRMKKLGITNP